MTPDTELLTILMAFLAGAMTDTGRKKSDHGIFEVPTNHFPFSWTLHQGSGGSDGVIRYEVPRFVRNPAHLDGFWRNGTISTQLSQEQDTSKLHAGSTSYDI